MRQDIPSLHEWQGRGSSGVRSNCHDRTGECLNGLVRDSERFRTEWTRPAIQNCSTGWLASLSPNTAETAATTFNHLEKLINPKNLQVLDATILSRFQAALRKTGIKETSIASHLRHLRAALSWAVAMQLLPVRPDIQMPKRARGRSLMRGRPITSEEFDRLLAAVPKVRAKDAESWQFYLRGLWLSGLRLEESTILSWDLDAPITVDFKGRRPRLRISAEAEKGHQDRLLPMTPDFAQFLLAVPREERKGPIFKLPNPAGKQMTAKRACRIIPDIGRKAGVVVNKAENKFGH
jgi:site-specific recombinase XerD